jgi:response regulator RpfG family c-di-GMP phosphodiesterase
MSVKFGATIVLIGVTPIFRNDLFLHLGDKYNFLELQTKFSIKALELFTHIELFFFDIDQPQIKLDAFYSEIKAHNKYQVIPIIGLASKKYFKDLGQDLRGKFDDIILLPTSMEDVLTRIDLWLKTAKAMKKNN